MASTGMPLIEWRDPVLVKGADLRRGMVVRYDGAREVHRTVDAMRELSVRDR